MQSTMCDHLIFSALSPSLREKIKYLYKNPYMKKLFLFSLLFISYCSFSSVTIYYKNADKKEVKLKIMIDGEVKEVIFKAKGGKLFIKGKAENCMFYTSCEERTLKDGDEIEIVGGCIKK